MKTFLLLAFATTIGFAASAQYKDFNNYNQRPPTRDHRLDKNYNNKRSMEMRLAEINRDYDNRVDIIRHRSAMRARDRRQQIRQIEKERALALRNCRDNYSMPYASGYAVPPAKPSVGITVHFGF